MFKAVSQATQGIINYFNTDLALLRHSLLMIKIFIKIFFYSDHFSLIN